MKKYLLVAINSQYIHTNLAVRYLKKYIEEYSDENIQIYETNINNQISNMIRDIFELSPDVVIFSTYIWNKEEVFKLLKELKKVLPNIKIGLGGPEVSYGTEKILEKNEEVDFIIQGEGERALLELVQEGIKNIGGTYSQMMPADLDEIPFPYSLNELLEENKILYYETSRGCPFKCSYCLSSIESMLKTFSVDRVIRDLGLFLSTNIKLLKFVDRTFNINHERMMKIWSYLIENYRPGIIFHFEINANVLTEESLELLKKVPKDYFQFEVGIQTTNWATMESINRKNSLDELKNNIEKIPKNIHTHLDLIAGLPYETYKIFKNSFNYVHNLKPDMIQLGFLKMLKGTQIYNQIEEYEYKFTDYQPYEVLSNQFISFKEIYKLKEIEKILNYYYNSRKFKNSINFIITNYYSSSFELYEDIRDYYREKKLMDIGHKEVSLFKYLIDFFDSKQYENRDIFLEYLKFDFLNIGKVGLENEWLKRNKDSEKHNDILKSSKYTSIREGHKNTELEIFNYNILKNIPGKITILFDYKEKNFKEIY